MDNKEEVPTVVIDSSDIPISLSIHNESSLNFDTYVNIQGYADPFISNVIVKSLFNDFTTNDVISIHEIMDVLTYYGYSSDDASALYNQLVRNQETLTYSQFQQALKYNNLQIDEIFKQFLFTLATKPHRYTLVQSRSVRLDRIEGKQNKLDFNSAPSNTENKKTINHIISEYGALLFGKNRPTQKWMNLFLQLANWCCTGTDEYLISISTCLSIACFRIVDIQSSCQLLKFIFNVIWDSRVIINSVRFECLVHVSRHVLQAHDFIEDYGKELVHKIRLNLNINDVYIGLYLFTLISGLVINNQWIETDGNDQKFNDIIMKLFRFVYFEQKDETAKKQAALLFEILPMQPLWTTLSETNCFNVINRYTKQISLEEHKHKQLQRINLIKINELNDRILNHMNYTLFPQQNGSSNQSDDDNDLDFKELQYVVKDKMEYELDCAVSNLAVASMVGVLEYISTELTELCGNQCMDQNFKRIEPRHINRVLADDLELRKLFLHLLPIEKLYKNENEHANKDNNHVEMKYDPSWHDINKPFKCHRCRKGFPDKQALDQHKRTVHGS